MTLPTKSSPTCSAMYKPKLPYSSYNCLFFSSLKFDIEKYLDIRLQCIVYVSSQPEYTVGVINLLKHLLCLFIIGVFVRVIFQRQFSILFLNIRVRGGLGYV